jgi:hypothetical protein
MNLVQICSKRIADTIYKLKYNDVMNNTVIRHSPKNVGENILFQVILLRQKMSNENSGLLDHQKILESTYPISNYRSKLLFNLQHYNFQISFRLGELSYDQFKFYDSINSGFINITDNDDCLQKFAYHHVDLNVDISSIILQIKNFINEEDINNCLIAGGIFSKYRKFSYISKHYISLFDIIQDKADVDIFMSDKDKQLFNKYLLLFKNKYKLCPFEINSGSYKFNCFKIVLNDLTYNFIFSGSRVSILEMILGFDFDLCKIFYSFKLNATFMNVTLFENFHKIKSFRITPRIMKRTHNMQDLTHYMPRFKTFKRVILRQRFDFNGFEMKEWINDILFYEVKGIPRLKQFIDIDFVRTLKYYFKGYYFDNQDDLISQKILFFILIFHDYIVWKFLNKDKICNRDVGSCNKCIENISNGFTCSDSLTKFCECLYKFVSN